MQLFIYLLNLLGLFRKQKQSIGFTFHQDNVNKNRTGAQVTIKGQEKGKKYKSKLTSLVLFETNRETKNRTKQ